MGQTERLERARELLERLGLGERLTNRPGELSGGQQQRVSIARALMNGGDIILADEPTGALDSKSGEQVMAILMELHQAGHTIILVTHDRHIADYASRVIEIRDGEIIADTRRAPEPEDVEHSAPAFARRNRLLFMRDQLLEAMRMSVQAIFAHKLRSLLTMLGIIIGIASVVTVVALGRGSQEKILADISAMGTNTIDIMPGSGFGDRRAGRVRTLTVDDSNALAQQSYIASSTPRSSSSGDLTRRNISVTAQMNGVGVQYFDVKGLSIAQGRMFNEDEVRASAAVVVIDQNTKKELFPGGENPLGEVILFKGKPLQIIGVAAEQNASFGPTENLTLWTPYTTLMNRITGARYISSITVKIRDEVSPVIAEKQLTRFLTVKHRGKQDFFTINTDSIRKTIESTTGTMTLLISGIALISLVVGGIGVMNIMLVSVTERTREIGIRMAIGARQRNVLAQFLIEAVLICIMGGTLGVLLSYAIGLVFSLVTNAFTLSYSGASIALALACSSLIGVVFGFVPARNASRLNPVDALSRE